MCDLHGLVTFVQQNCKKAGISSNSGGIPSARNMPGSGTGKRGKGKDAAFTAAVADMRMLMEDQCDQQLITDTENQLILLSGEVRKAESEVSTR